FLENILLELKKANILESKKGKGGGYYISSPPAETKIATIIRIVDGPIALLPCVSLNFYEKCKQCDEGNCGLHDMMAEVRDATLGVLENRTLQDLSPGKESLNK
ncbi:MAG TPA: Rrf2 family transcriptional regulator, partial [Chitinophagaceae bacterium]